MKTASILSIVLSPSVLAIALGVLLLHIGKTGPAGFAYILIGGIVVSMVNAVITGIGISKK
jgi:hypothetical protein